MAARASRRSWLWLIPLSCVWLLAACTSAAEGAESTTAAVAGDGPLVLVRIEAADASAKVGASERLTQMLRRCLTDALTANGCFRAEDFELARDVRRTTAAGPHASPSQVLAPRYVLSCNVPSLRSFTELRFPLLLNVLEGSRMLQAAVTYRLTDLRAGAVLSEDTVRPTVAHPDSVDLDDPAVAEIVARCAHEIAAAVSAAHDHRRELLLRQ